MYRFGFVVSCFRGRSPLGTCLLMSEQQPGSGGFHPRIPLIPRIGAHLGRPATGRERGRSGCGTDGVKTSHTTEGLVFTPPVSHSPRLRRGAGRPRIEERPRRVLIRVIRVIRGGSEASPFCRARSQSIFLFVRRVRLQTDREYVESAFRRTVST